MFSCSKIQHVYSQGPLACIHHKSFTNNKPCSIFEDSYLNCGLSPIIHNLKQEQTNFDECVLLAFNEFQIYYLLHHIDRKHQSEGFRCPMLTCWILFVCDILFWYHTFLLTGFRCSFQFQRWCVVAYENALIFGYASGRLQGKFWGSVDFQIAYVRIAKIQKLKDSLR